MSKLLSTSAVSSLAQVCAQKQHTKALLVIPSIFQRTDILVVADKSIIFGYFA